MICTYYMYTHILIYIYIIYIHISHTETEQLPHHAVCRFALVSRPKVSPIFRSQHRGMASYWRCKGRLVVKFPLLTEVACGTSDPIWSNLGSSHMYVLRLSHCFWPVWVWWRCTGNIGHTQERSVFDLRRLSFNHDVAAFTMPCAISSDIAWWICNAWMFVSFLYFSSWVEFCQWWARRSAQWELTTGIPVGKMFREEWCPRNETTWPMVPVLMMHNAHLRAGHLFLAWPTANCKLQQALRWRL